MWIFSKSGFVSVVKHRDKPGFVLVRGRTEADVTNFRDACGGPRVGYPVAHTPEADYLYRVAMPAVIASNGVASLCLDIDYDNFKNAVHERDEPTRDRAMVRVWQAMHDYQEAIRPDGPRGCVGEAMARMSEVCREAEELAFYWDRRLADPDRHR